MLALHPERLSARREDAEHRLSPEQPLGELRDGIDKLFASIEDGQHVLVAQDGQQALESLFGRGIGGGILNTDHAAKCGGKPGALEGPHYRGRSG